MYLLYPEYARNLPRHSLTLLLVYNRYKTKRICVTVLPFTEKRVSNTTIRFRIQFLKKKKTIFPSLCALSFFSYYNIGRLSLSFVARNFYPKTFRLYTIRIFMVTYGGERGRTRGSFEKEKVLPIFFLFFRFYFLSLYEFTFRSFSLRWSTRYDLA